MTLKRKQTRARSPEEKSIAARQKEMRDLIAAHPGALYRVTGHYCPDFTGTIKEARWTEADFWNVDAVLTIPFAGAAKITLAVENS
jgi:hypothetical protein